MAKKKKDQPELHVVPAEPEKTQEPIQEEQAQIKNLTREEVLTMKWLQAEAQCLAAQAEKRKLEREILLKKLDPSNTLLGMDNEIRQIWKNHGDYKTKYDAEIAKIETRLSISMKNYSYDDETGALLYIAG